MQQQQQQEQRLLACMLRRSGSDNKSHLNTCIPWPFCVQAAVTLVADQGFSDINICYSSPRGDDLDTRLLRAMVIKGILEQITTSNVNLVNADLLAKNRGLRISEVTIRTEGR
jgi:hypothetical protein